MFAQKPEKEGRAIDLLTEGKEFATLGKIDTAVTLFREAQSLARQVDDLRILAEATTHLGIAYTEQARFALAKTTLDSVISLGDLIDPMAPAVLMAKRELLRIAVKENEVMTASRIHEHLLKEILQIRPEADSHLGMNSYVWEQSSTADNHASNTLQAAEVNAAMHQASTYRHLGIQDSAMLAVKTAWRIAVPETPFAEVPPASVLDQWQKPHLVEILQEQGEVLTVGKDPVKLEAGLACFETALTLLDSQYRYSYLLESSPTRLKTHRRLFELGIRTASKLFEQTGEEELLEKAWVFSERSKSLGFREYLSEMPPAQMGGVPDSLLNQEQYFRQRLAFLASLQNKAEQPNDTLQTQIHQLIDQYRALLPTLEKNHPAYYSLMHSQEVVPSEYVLDNLYTRQALISYVWGEDEVFLFTLWDDELSLSSIPRNKSFDRQLEGWLKFISNRPSTATFKSLDPRFVKDLSLLLIPQLSERVIELILVPDGKLCYLPFESLVEGEIPSADFREWPFLMKEKTINYATSATVWEAGEFDESDFAEYIGFAPNFLRTKEDDHSNTSSGLPFQAAEVAETAALLEGEAVTDELATESRLKSLDDEYTVLHVATDPFASGFLLQADDSSGEDGIVSIQELYGLSIESPLVVLSRSEAQQGPMGEGLKHFAQAFHHSGANRLMASIWPTDREAEYTVVTRFFAELQKGRNPAKALQNSQTQWLESASEVQGHPYYWSGFVLIGDSGHILLEVNRGLPWWELFIGMMVALFLFMWWWSRGASSARETNPNDAVST